MECLSNISFSDVPGLKVVVLGLKVDYGILLLPHLSMKFEVMSSVQSTVKW